MAKTLTINVYSDPGHGWGKVKKSTLVKYGIADKISHYSYMRTDYAYLEEDCDLSLLITTLRENNIVPKFKEFCGDKSSKIRNYTSYKNVKDPVEKL